MRGANPRTGIISPYIPSGNPEAGDGNDYVHVGWVQKEHESSAPANERWRQDDHGWSLVECESDFAKSKPVATRSSDLTTASATARAPSGSQQPKGPMETDGTTDHGNNIREEVTRNDTDLASNVLTSPPVDAMVLSQSLSRIPRKTVGSKKCSLESRPDQIQRENPISGPNGHYTSSNDKASNSSMPVPLDSTALGFHAYPSQPSVIHRPPSSAPQVRHQYGNLGVRDPHLKSQRFRSRNRFASFGTSPSLSANPNLEITYRRPKELLPACFRGSPILNSKSAQKKSELNLIGNKDKAIEQRPHFKRVVATTSVPVTHLIKDMENIAMNKTEVPLSLYRARAASSQYQGATWEEEGLASPIDVLDASTCAARKAFRSTQAWKKPCQEITTRPLVDYAVQRSLQPLNHDNDSKSPAVGRRMTEGDTKELLDALRVVVDELSSLINFSRLRRQLYNIVKQALLTTHQAPRAIRTLRRHDVDVSDYFLAVRHMMIAVLCLVVLFSALAAMLKVLKLVADIGRCLWYPVGLLITMIQWIMLYEH
ncbi:MAG: hypothetical protein Q9216_002123 [Gyalolechia sp. 2 TL-2023]